MNPLKHAAEFRITYACALVSLVLIVWQSAGLLPLALLVIASFALWAAGSFESALRESEAERLKDVMTFREAAEGLIQRPENSFRVYPKLFYVSVMLNIRLIEALEHLREREAER